MALLNTDHRREQGGQIMDNALCGGAGATLTGNALAAVKAAIFMGDPHNIAGLSYNVGTCTAGGVSEQTSLYYLVLASCSVDPRSRTSPSETGEYI